MTSVIIPCVAGRFFEVMSTNLPRIVNVAVIIPCVAGRFFEALTVAQSRNT